MPSEAGFYCVYVDHTSAPVTDMGRLLQILDSKNITAGANECYLVTCQRCEYYVYAPEAYFPFNILSSLLQHAKIVSGQFNILRRLTLIASGSESLLLGERFIPQQVERSFRHLPPETPLAILSKEAIRLATIVRESFAFHAPKDYGDIAFDLLQNPTPSCADQARVLVTIGSGMLGRALALHPASNDYKTVIAVSRWPKELRKKLGRSTVTCVHPETLLRTIGIESFDVALALSNVTPEYISFLQDLISLPNCRAIVDLSTFPISTHSRPQRYIHEYDDAFTDHLTTLSHPLRCHIPALNQMVDLLARDSVTTAIEPLCAE